jgi:hypothetical protein
VEEDEQKKTYSKYAKEEKEKKETMLNENLTPTTLSIINQNIKDSNLDAISISPLVFESKNLENLFEIPYGQLFSPNASTETSYEMKDSFLHLLEDGQFPSISPLTMNLPSPNLLKNNFLPIQEQKPPELKLPPDSEKKKFIKKRKKQSKEEEKKPTESFVPTVPLSIPMIPQQVPIPHERMWKTVFLHPKLQNQNIGIRIQCKTRCDQPSDIVEDKLYSSLKYEIRQYITGSFCSTLPFLLSRIRVVDHATGNPIVKDKRTVLKGIIEAALTKQPGGNDNEVQGVLKTQFTDVSYHHKKSHFCWEISYFEPNELNNPILITRSAPFKVYARKPNQNKKRKRQCGPFEDFCNRLEDLQKCFKKLKNSEDKATALKLVQEKIITLDPTFLHQGKSGDQIGSYFS